MILSKAEEAAIKRGKKIRYRVEAVPYDVVRILRSPQSQRDLCIRSFAVTFLTAGGRDGWTAADSRHARALIKLFKEVGLV